MASIESSALIEFEDDAVMAMVKESRRNAHLRNIIQNPRQTIDEKPLYAAFISVPAGLIFLAAGLRYTWGTPNIDDIIIFSVLLSISIPGVMHYRKRRRIKRIERYFPDFLRDISEINRAGMTLPKALSSVAKGEYGELTEEIEHMSAMVSWGISFEAALQRFANRIRTPLIERCVGLIIFANKSGGNVPDVLAAAAKDARELQLIDDERLANMLIYVVICYMSFFVFIFVVLILKSTFIPIMAEAGATTVGAAGAGQQLIRAFNPEQYSRLFFHAAVLQGFCSGLVAGQMGEGEVAAGLKHSVIMTLIAWLFFTIGV